MVAPLQEIRMSKLEAKSDRGNQMSISTLPLSPQFSGTSLFLGVGLPKMVSQKTP
jgi:hypothetical protein